jgi:dTMP kinase
MQKNVFIAFEGIDGSGKSTQVKLLTEKLEASGHKVYSTFEPTKSDIGKMIRTIFGGKMEADHKVIAALFAADRLDHLLNKTDGILKMLADGYTVITDRYYFSSYAYHSVYMPMDWVIATNDLSAKLLRPDMNIYIDVSPEESMQRITKGRTSTELYETLENLINVKNFYNEAFEKMKAVENICMINGERNETEIAEDVWKNVEKLLEIKNH